MPREVKAYGCEFKCGQKVVLSKNSMIDHESRCFRNPEKKACVTCKYFERFNDSNGMEGTSYNQEWITLFCNAPKNFDELSKMQNNCDFHELKI